MIPNSFDSSELYCRKLGHEVPFKYCKQENNDLPCRKVFDCWQGRFDIIKSLKENLSEEEIQSLVAPPQPKMSQLFDLIEKAKKKAE